MNALPHHSRRRDRGHLFLAFSCLSMALSLPMFVYVSKVWDHVEPILISHLDEPRAIADTKVEWQIQNPQPTHNERNSLIEFTSLSSSDRDPDGQTLMPLRSCALELVVTISELPAQNNSEAANQGTVNTCKGFMLRDDMVLTSKKCAKNAVVVEIPGYENRLVTSKIESPAYNLALVRLQLPEHNTKAGPEYHPQSGWPRLRIFLNERNDGDMSNEIFCYSSDQGDITFRISCANFWSRPILFVFSSEDGNTEPVPIPLFKDNKDDAFSVEIREMLGSVKDWGGSIAAMSNTQGEQWWIRKVSTVALHGYITALFKKYSARTKGAISITGGLGLSGLLELDDPSGGRSYSCLKRYFRVWVSDEPHSGEPFFQWLDYGSGKEIDHENCSHSKLNEKHMQYYNATERKKTAVNLAITDEGKTIRLTWNETGLPVSPGKWQFVQGTDKVLYLILDNKGITGHATVFAGDEVLHAGEMHVCNEGWLRRMNSKSGHYRPQLEHAIAFNRWLKERGVSQEAVLFTRNATLSFEAWKTVFGEPILHQDLQDIC